MYCTAGAESFGNMQRRRFLAKVTDGLRRAGLPNNEGRLHSALGYRPRSEFEQMQALPAARVHGHAFPT